MPHTRSTLATTMKSVETATVAAPLSGLVTRGERCTPPTANAMARATAAAAKATSAAVWSVTGMLLWRYPGVLSPRVHYIRRARGDHGGDGPAPVGPRQPAW